MSKEDESNRYPEIRQRGYYSEILSEGALQQLENVTSGPSFAPNLYSQTARIEHGPPADTFQTGENLHNSVSLHGGSTKIENICDFPEKSFQPKMQLMYYTPPGSCPRDVRLEREKRKYAEYQLEQLLAEEGLISDEMMPKHHPPNGKKSDGSWAPYLFLETFDDEEYEIRNPDEWLAMGLEDGVRKPVPGRALLPNVDDQHDVDIRDPKITWVWHSVGVLDYDNQSKLWLVQKMNKDGRIVDESGQPVVDGGLMATGHFLELPTQYWIPRVQLMFLAENPVQFASRVVSAVRSRNLTEALLRYHLYLDCMPMDGLGELDPTSLKRMIRLSKEETPVLRHKKKLEEAVQGLEKEVMVDYWRSMNTIILHKLVCENRQKFSYIVLPKRDPPKVPMKGTLPMPKYDWDRKFEEFAFYSLLTKPEVVQALCKSEYECLEARNKQLFHVPLAKHMRLDEFEQTQSQATQQVSLFLKDTWVDNLQKYIRTSLRDSGKGWFNIFETDFYVYSKSKLKKFMELVKYCMQDSMRYLTLDSLNNYVNMISDACYACQRLDLSYKWPNDLVTSSLPPKKNPIFLVDLVLDQTGCHYSTPLESFSSTCVNLYDKAILALQSVPQLEQFILKDISWADNPLLESVGIREPQVVTLRESLRQTIEKALIPMEAYSHEYDKFLDLQNQDIADYISAFLRNYEAQNHTAAEIKAEVEKHLMEKDLLEQLIPSFIIVGPFYVNVENVRQGLAKKRRAMANAVLDLLARELRKAADEACEEFKRISRKLYEKPNTIEELAELREWILTIPDSLDEQQEVIDKCLADYDLIEEFYYNLSNDDFNAKWTMFGWPHKIRVSIVQVEQSLLEDEERFRKLQVGDVSAFNEKLDNLTMSVASMVSYNDITKAHEVANEVRRIHKQLTDAQANAVLFNNRERLFNQPVTNYEKLNKLVKDFEPFRNLWISVSDWSKLHDSVMNDPLTSVDSEVVEKNVADFYKTMHKSVKIFNELPSVQEVASQIKVAIEEFKPFIPLIQGLRNPGMRARHWEILSEELKISIVPKATLTFSKCLEMRLQDYIEVISKIAEVAGKEYAIEQALNKMTVEWEALKFEVISYKASGTFIIKVSDEINQLLDDHIVMTQSMGFSPYKKPFEERIAKWETTLRTTQDVIDEWLQCQRQWLYLEPIFSSDDINRQLPVEGKRYATMDRMWRKIMKTASENPSVITLCPDSRLLNNLKECNKLLEQVQKGLSEYLETKRQSFPRFYFLSDDELLEILSQTKDPTAVQPHLRKCFENIAKLQFEKDLEITAMFSGEGEKIVFEKSTYPSGNVEEWMLEIENMMRDSLRIIIGKSLLDYKQIPRTDWVLKWPGQVVIAGCQTYWTQEVSDALENKDLKTLYVRLLAQLDGLRTLVRGDMTKIGRQTLSALIVIEVHARDVVNNMIVEEVQNINDFEWISQLRYYWIAENLKIRAVNAEFPYGYEYLGNTSRLVITPLTDRCYLTLTGALHLKFGGAPAGPAGTGKTETTKDLGKAFAIQCVVFNCSDQLDFMAMGKFFKGLASAGAWACFDEFNRIDIEVLSVVAQQITTIQKAQEQRLERFMFEGVELTLKASCAVFITMNPGYAGRTELPDNLKALFRPVAMMVPDYALIAEISLFSFGFSDARVLAKKIVTTFKLSSEQLSSQDHYDFGMRAVKSVISAAGNLKRQNPIMDEELICLRAIRDVNVPKFLMDDLKLFNGIVSDLFPNIKYLMEEPIDYGDLLTAIQTAARRKNLKDVEGFVNKCIQLFETTVVRHGLMLVGPTGSGKTKCYEVLQMALSSLKDQPSPDGGTFETVHTYVLNPKSITMGQLYGEFDLMTHEWTDGILSTLIRQGVVAGGPDKRWYVFDGPVDAVWIENMNTVLDDNKKLCLSSGEIIKLLEEMTMMFEVADLAVASPATVSRCGMVYLEPSILGLAPFVECWLMALPDAIYPHRERLQRLFDFYLEDTVDFLRRNVREIIPTTNGQLTFSLLKLMETFIHPFVPEDLAIEAKTTKKKAERQMQKNNQNLKAPLRPLKVKKTNKAERIPDEVVTKIGEAVESWFLFSLIWSFGATGDTDSRRKFDSYLRKKMATQLVLLPLPVEGLVYDYRFDHGGTLSLAMEEEEAEEEVVRERKMQWVQWMAGMPDFVIKPETRYSDVIVPTMDTVRLIHLAEQLLVAKKPVLCVGPTGTGKTLSISDKLTRFMPPEYITEFIVFSAKTTSNQTQDLIDSKLDKRRKGVFGPPIGKNLIFFIDDLNMPALDAYGAQPPIELIRQWCDFAGWYDRRAIGEFRALIEINFIVAMGPPGGGRNPISQRLVRHFNLIGFNELQEESMRTVFGTILKFWLARAPEALRTHEDKLVRCCIEVYRAIQAQLLPTPAKSHYTFNLRDLSKVFQGMLMLEPESLTAVDQLLRLWVHESCRVFQDRLVNDQDRDWFKGLLVGKLATEFNHKYEDVVKIEPLLYGDFMSVSIDNKKYIEFTELDKMLKVIEENLEDYNQINTAKMNLVLFMDAVRHICRIARIIRQPLGNALLLGMGGSGRQSLTRLASHMAEFDCFQIELSKNYGIAEWRDDLKRIMMAAGLENKPMVFLFSDTQIKDDSFLEDLNNILNAGDVPNLYSFDDLERIYGDMKPIVQEMNMQATKTNLFSAYTKRVRINLHTVITMSPIGEVFRARLRQFPALVNCCTIDWFSQWPQEALESVALKFLNDIPELEVSEEVIKGLVMMCKEIHQSVTNYTEKYRQQLSRHNYVTPTSYLELLGIFSKIYGLKKVELQQARNRTKNGLDKLLYTEEIVQKLQEELEIMKPQLEQAVEESKATKEEIERDSIMAEETRVVVTREEAVAAKKTKECETIRDDAQRDLDEALPALFESLESLKKLNKNDITEVRGMLRPPEGVRLVMETVCIMKDVKPKKVAGDKPGVKIDDYWDSGKALLADPGRFLESLFNYDKDNIPDAIIQKIEPYIGSENFQPSAIEKVSKACTSICSWVRAMYKYHFVSKSVAPKREALERSEKELDETKRILKEARNKLKAVEDRIMGLQEKLEACNRRQKELENKSDLCEARLTRADKLIGGLSSEKIRWLEAVGTLEHLINNIVGNVLLSAGYVAYLGTFTGEYRADMCREWTGALKTNGVPHTDKPAANLVDTFGDPVKIRNWQIDGLPKDTLSTENAVIVQFSRRWPLFIDPQGQANRWIKNLQRDNGLDVIKLSDKDFLRSLENAVRFGKPCLLENVGEELDPALEPILLKQTFKQQGALVIKLGDAVIPYHDDFKFYITTKLPNPHYTPEVSTKVTIVNFTLSPSGLEDQLLGMVVAAERPDLEDAKNQLIVSNAKMKQELKEIEDKILYRLSAAEGSPVDDIDLIQTLEASKLKSNEIQAKVVIAEQTEKDIDETRSRYIPVAVRTQILFFCVADLAQIDPMYQYSLEWFLNIFQNGILNASKAETLTERIDNINDYFTFSLYSNVCRSLFEKHKLLFSFLLATRILQNEGKIDMAEWRYLLAGGTQKLRDLPNPAPQWISDRVWGEILTLGALPHFAKFPEEFSHSLLDGFKKIFDSPEPHREVLPGEWNDFCDRFQKLLVLRCLRMDKVTNAMQDFVAHFLGNRFIEPQAADLTLVYKDSSPTTPLIFVLSPGTDPATDLYKFADDMKFSKKLSAISLGQGQGPRAEELLRGAMERGKWIFFQNCHLSPSWMPSLERLVEQIDKDKVHRDFRLWLTSMPSPKFPVFILQNGSKMTVEPPRGIKANLLKSYTGFTDEILNSVAKNSEWRHLLFSLCLFHGVLIERKKFGPLGFNIPYEFTDGDLRICINQLSMFLTEYVEVPFKVLKYTAGHINYGGRVTDDWDRRCVMNILADFYTPLVMNEEHLYSESGVYRQISPANDHAGYMNYVRSLPINDTPEIFGLHDNANITFAINGTNDMLNDLLKLQPKASTAGGKSREEIVEEVSQQILAGMPDVFDEEFISKKYPVMYEQSMNTVLIQEVIRYNRLLRTISGSLRDLLKAIQGLVVMSEALENMSNSLYDNRVPGNWAAKAYPSLKPLASWVTDLHQRIAFIQGWIDNGVPPVFWISGFFFPQAFLTGTLQNFARKKVVSIDTISFSFQVLASSWTEMTEVPSDGCYIRGLFVEGARWDMGVMALAESRPKDLFTDMPVVWLVPAANRQVPLAGVYDCPVYKTLTRAGTLSTTGHSTNFVFSIEVPSSKDQNHWIKRGVALLCALNY